MEWQGPAWDVILDTRPELVERGAKRYQVTLPVRIGEGTGVTRDLSTSGVFYETEKLHHLGETVALAADFDACTLQFEGSVVRVEQVNGHFGVAVALTSFRFS